ncbi:carbohydrate ABC transporter permease [Kitasatospora sp. A2-31]|uniref:carbohydrate ABC transporter permease n=1 Tax=Kitasatospora sp. A2-31 TaxID=2916414 RepID=UPI001EEBA457|nr:carbohydrate ABC transporter permease [Kitasatospora sp. A2-31]MCG6498033.1 carbohydrate ABC transporter permease [Kitasatospora sp. A2-31]
MTTTRTAPSATTTTVPAPASARRPALPVTTRLAALTRSGLVQAVLITAAVAWLVPTVGLLISSLRPKQVAATGGWWTALTEPAQLTLQNYTALLGGGEVPEALWNTVLISVPATLLTVALAAGAGYAFAWMRFPGRDAVFLGVVGLLVVPVQVGLIPVAKLEGAVGLFGTIPGVVLFHVGYGLPFAVFLMRNHFLEIPAELLEAARMDGCGEWRIFRALALPLAAPAVASLCIFQFLWVWNDMLVALIFAGNDSQPLTVYLQSQMRQFGSNMDILAPGAFLSLLVPVAVFLCFQRFFIQGAMAGSVK